MDFGKCSAILAGRKSCEVGSQRHHHSEEEVQEGCLLGQVIDLRPSAPSSESVHACEPPQETSTHPSNKEETILSVEAQAQQSVHKLQEGLTALPVRELVKTFRQAQEERVQAYNFFDQGLAQILSSRAFTEYDALCAEATAKFAVLSNLVNAVAECLGRDPYNRVVLARLLRRIQAEEKEKLSLTAALHLEKFRLATSTCSGAAGNENSDGREAMLLREGARRLETNIRHVVCRINDVLEEIRYEEEEE